MVGIGVDTVEVGSKFNSMVANSVDIGIDLVTMGIDWVAMRADVVLVSFDTDSDVAGTDAASEEVCGDNSIAFDVIISDFRASDMCLVSSLVDRFLIVIFGKMDCKINKSFLLNFQNGSDLDNM